MYSSIMGRSNKKLRILGSNIQNKKDKSKYLKIFSVLFYITLPLEFQYFLLIKLKTRAWQLDKD